MLLESGSAATPATILADLPESWPTPSRDIGDHVAEYAACGWRVFPLHGKVPAIANSHPRGSAERQTCKGNCGQDGHGVLDATSDLAKVEMWWHGPYAGTNIGARVPENVFVLDVDPRSGGAEALARLEAEHDPLPATLTAVSGRGDGGRHYYFRAPRTRLTSRFLGSGLDLKTSSGYCVVPPSIHPETGRQYDWINDVPILEPPTWLSRLVVVVPSPVRALKPRTGSECSAASSTSIADRYAELVTWAEILEPHGWRCLDSDSEADGARWLHPAATSSCSATIRHRCMFVYTSNTAFEPTTHGDVHGYTKFRAAAVLDHAGDLSAAARALKGRVL